MRGKEGQPHGRDGLRESTGQKKSGGKRSFGILIVGGMRGFSLGMGRCNKWN